MQSGGEKTSVFVNGEGEKKCNTTRIKENFYGRPATLISHSCPNTDPSPAKPTTPDIHSDSKSTST